MQGSKCIRLLAILMLASGVLGAQSGRLNPPAIAPSPGADRPPAVNLRHAVPYLPSEVGFSSVAQAAGIIFSGTVSAVERRPATGGQTVETVAVTFHVENAIRGSAPGEDLTISQWIGLWSSGQRYRVGERVLVFLYPPSKLGLTSCVAGALGRFAVDAQGRVNLSAQQVSAFRADPVLGGRSRVRLSDLASTVRRASGEE